MATFSEELVAGSVDSQTAYLEDTSALPVVATVAYDAPNRSILITPESPLEEGTGYIVTFTRDIEGVYSGTLGAVILSEFTTGGGLLTNELPTADAGPDQEGSVGTRIQLDGAASSDPEGEALTYAWRVVAAPAGSTASLTKDAAVKTAMIPDLPGEYVIGLTVNDGLEDSSEDYVAIQAVSSDAPGDDTGTAPLDDTGVSPEPDTGL